MIQYIINEVKMSYSKIVIYINDDFHLEKIKRIIHNSGTTFGVCSMPHASYRSEVALRTARRDDGVDKFQWYYAETEYPEFGD